jgi:hypothetical protein
MKNALNDVVTQNDEVKKQEEKKEQKTNHLASVNQELNEWANLDSKH